MAAGFEALALTAAPRVHGAPRRLTARELSLSCRSHAPSHSLLSSPCRAHTLPGLSFVATHLPALSFTHCPLIHRSPSRSQPRTFSSGAAGWYLGGKVELKIGGADVWAQVGADEQECRCRGRKGADEW